MRRTRLSIIVAVGLTVMLAACGSSAGRPATAPPATNPVRLSLVTAGDEAKAALYPQPQPRYVLDGDLADLGATAPVRTPGGPRGERGRRRPYRGDARPARGASTRTDWGYEVRDGDALLNVETVSGATWIDYSSTGNAGGGSSAARADRAARDRRNRRRARGDVPPDAPDSPVADEPPAPPVPVPTIPPPVDVPNDDDAVQIAQSLLDDLGVLDDQQWAHDVSPARAPTSRSRARPTRRARNRLRHRSAGAPSRSTS